jgi:hypothetical protein
MVAQDKSETPIAILQKLNISRTTQYIFYEEAWKSS